MHVIYVHDLLFVLCIRTHVSVLDNKHLTLIIQLCSSASGVRLLRERFNNLHPMTDRKRDIDCITLMIMMINSLLWITGKKQQQFSVQVNVCFFRFLSVNKNIMVSSSPTLISLVLDDTLSSQVIPVMLLKNSLNY